MGQINNRLGNTLLETGVFPPCRAATTGAITLAGLQTIDGVTLIAGDRVLVWQQVDQTTNGIYAASTGNWVRTTDALSNTQFFQGMVVVVALGTTYATKIFMCTCTDDPVVIGTSRLTFMVMATLGNGILFNQMAAGVIRERLSADRTYYLRQPRVAVTISIASPGVVTWTAHGLVANATVAFDTTGALPTGLTRGVVYYVKTVIGANSFTVSATAGGAVINTSGSQSGQQYGQTGSDSASGLDNGANALMTINAYTRIVCQNIDLNGHNVFGQVSDGAYAEIIGVGPYVGRQQQGHVMPSIQGNHVSPRNVWIKGGVSAIESGTMEWVLKDLQIDGDGVNPQILADVGVWIVCDNVTFGANVNQNHCVAENEGIIEFVSSYTIDCGAGGGAFGHVLANFGGKILYSGLITVTLLNTPTFTSGPAAGFINLQNNGFYVGGTVTYTGPTVGQKWSRTADSVMYIGSNNPDTYFPGTIAGAAITTKLISFTYDLSTATGTQTIGGVGFLPSTVIFLYALNGTQAFGVGMVDGTRANATIFEPSNANVFDIQGAAAIEYSNAAGTVSQVGILTAYVPDGFTISWTKAGAPSGSLQVYALCIP